MAKKTSDQIRDHELFDAVDSDSPRRVEAALRAGANIRSTREYRRTALMFAADLDSPECLLLLIKAGAQLDAADCSGCTALSIACSQARFAAAHALLDSGAGHSALNCLGHSPLDFARGLLPKLRSRALEKDARALVKRLAALDEREDLGLVAKPASASSPPRSL